MAAVKVGKVSMARVSVSAIQEMKTLPAFKNS